MKRAIKLLPLTLLIQAAFAPFAFAEAEQNLGELHVQASASHKLNTQRKSQTLIQNELIHDTRDLVRYTPDVGISDNGRHLKGFAIRGVEDNRVGVSVDGVSLPDSEENTLYSRYGNFNTARLSVDPELVKNIDLTKGSASFDAGSGALGGVVNYQTLSARDLVLPNNRVGGLLRSGYASKNREWANTVGAAYVGDKLDAIALYSQRYGHQMDSNGHGEFYAQNKSQHPDPSQHRFHSYLAKIGYRFTPEHKVGVSVTGQNGTNTVDERSYTSYGSAWREAEDKYKRLNVNTFYEYAPEQSAWLASWRTDLDYMRADLNAFNWAGTRNWRTKAKELNETKDRRLQTRYKRFTTRLDFTPFQAWGEHSGSLKVFAAQRDFENINKDVIGIGASYETALPPYTIQYPMKTTQFGVALKDSIRWNDQWSGEIGIRYDHEKVSPQELNAECSKSCKAEGKPRNASFSLWNGFANANWQFTPNWRLGYGISTGHRVPTASELFFTFENPYGTWKSNPDLKAERSVSHSLNLHGEGQKGRLDLSLYHTRYRNFLFEQENLIETESYGRKYQTPMMQMGNIDKARISGLEFSGSLKMGEGWKLFSSLGYSRGKMSSESSLLSIQPLKSVIGLDYEQPDGRWGVFSRLTYLGAKKARDAKTTEIAQRCTRYEFDPWYGEDVCMNIEKYKETTTYKHLNKSAFVFDVFGYYKPSKHLTLRAGVYNLFNRQYHTWDALRGINANSTTNSVDKDGYGLQRYYAPSRNFAVSAEYRF
ncbi:TonB-dependent hemoglobin/transferrin/lactoferrin family receptor [Kingella negevensis]|uniref:Hemoglobin and hemoglobin-haptoglobin-binding protein A n=1 Tax=Kingella negevensis TaxID=1522312 RepID=A0A238TAN7_9NEIS|nr:TonB-dependent hemoglobin/transferrin/lactoferrin family receptor [Kingella negevensis]MDK4679436.1 TonB-dependent hemoglobin/transferrin/lactoferrin family receptor [Kingella negevensis]MDK4682846.1 TonB-dependent hemoglobin/transferrin/lactoferrin family receptor [Kingella negevensis]MDK4691043.1 TonB-dependent hemoglobin/transferrin/lactoferrin family receptor [Kingella negevensis]MDK4693810.1 TonB-dependent hemoglobin/transferrin/lactoferrin family receptor [Kingella negevensis]MDK47002